MYLYPTGNNVKYLPKLTGLPRHCRGEICFYVINLNSRFTVHTLHNMHIMAVSCTHRFAGGGDKRQFGQECVASVRCTNSVRRCRRRRRHRRVAHLTDSSISVFARLWPKRTRTVRACVRAFCSSIWARSSFCFWRLSKWRTTQQPNQTKKKSTPLTRTERAPGTKHEIDFA